MPPAENGARESFRFLDYAIVGALLCLYLGAYVYLHYYVTSEKSAAIWGQHGDAMAPLTGVLSLVTLLLAIRSIRMQSVELQMQRETSGEQQKEVTETLKVLIQQAEAQLRQAHLIEQANQINRESNELTKQTIASYRENSRATIVAAINSIRVTQETLKVSTYNASEAMRYSPHAMQTGDRTQLERVKDHTEQVILDLEKCKRDLEQDIQIKIETPVVRS